MDVPSLCKMEAKDGMGTFTDTNGRLRPMAWEPIVETPRFGKRAENKRPQTAAH